MSVRRPPTRDQFPAENVARDEKYVLNYDNGGLIIRVEQLRGWMSQQAERLRPQAVSLMIRLRVLLAAALGWLSGAWTSAGERVRPVASAAGPQARRARAVLPQAASGAFDGVLPAAARAAAAVRHQVEAGRDARGTPRELRDSHGRRLRTSAYA